MITISYTKYSLLYLVSLKNIQIRNLITPMSFVCRLLITFSFLVKISSNKKKLITKTQIHKIKALTFLCRRRFINKTVKINEQEIIMNKLNGSTVDIFYLM